MKDLDEDARMIVEKNIDTAIKDPEVMEKVFRSTLRQQGIEPNLETILSYAMGHLSGLIDGLYISKYKRVLNKDEEKELAELLKRRAFELRQAFIGTRIEE